MTNGGSGQGLGHGARAAGANRVVQAVVWLSQAGHSGHAGLSYGGGKGCGAGRGSGGGTGDSSKTGERRIRSDRMASPFPFFYKP